MSVFVVKYNKRPNNYGFLKISCNNNFITNACNFEKFIRNSNENMPNINFVISALNTTVATLVNDTKPISANDVLNTTVAGYFNGTQSTSSSNSLNTTIATLLNGTQPISHIQNGTDPMPFVNSTWIPLNNTMGNSSSIYGDVPLYYNSSYWNYTVYCPSCDPNVVSVNSSIVTYDYAFTYIYYALLLVLLVVAITSVKV